MSVLRTRHAYLGGRARLLPATLLALTMVLVLRAGVASADGPPAPIPAPGGMVESTRVMVLFEAGVASTPAAAEKVKNAGGRLIAFVPGTDIAVVTVPAHALDRLRRLPEILAVEPDTRAFILGAPAGDPAGAAAAVEQPPEAVGWNIGRIGAETSWTLSTGRDVNVAVLDTGIDLDHLDLKANIEGGYMAIDTGRYAVRSRRTFDDDNGHGSHVAGIIGAVRGNGIGVVGVAPEVDLYAVKVLDYRGSGYLSDIIEGIRWAIKTRSDTVSGNDIDVINMSFGTTTNSWLFEDAVIDAESAGIVLVAAAGNSGPAENTVLYPAAYPSVVGVGATDAQDVVASFSSRGWEVHLAAPGVGITSTFNTGGYATYNGTSMASPHVAGSAALLKQANPSATVTDIIVSLGSRAADLGTPGRDTAYGFGLVRPDRSLGVTP